VRWRPGGQPAGCVDVQNAIARQRAWPKGCPPGAGHSRLGGRRRMWRPLVGTAATSTASTPTANISIVVKHIDGGRGGRRPRATTCALRMPSAHRSKHRFCAWLEARPLRGQASNGLHHDAADPSRLMACQLAVCKTLAGHDSTIRAGERRDTAPLHRRAATAARGRLSRDDFTHQALGREQCLT